MRTEYLVVGEPMPKLVRLEISDGFMISALWKTGVRAKADLSPDILTFKVYAPLRTDRALFESARIIDDGAAIGWGAGEKQIEMPATAIERLAALSAHADGSGNTP